MPFFPNPRKLVPMKLNEFTVLWNAQQKEIKMKDMQYKLLLNRGVC